MSLARLPERAAIWYFVATATAHMEMSWPYPLRSRFNPLNSYSVIDYSMTSPLIADGSNFPCKGYQNDRPIQPTASYTAGSTYNLTLAGSATHGGGSCQISLSYDNGATFRVIKSMIGGCPLTSIYDFKIPSYAPTGNALLAWTWQNRQGNRELYMNCAEVSIRARANQRSKRQSFDNLPLIWKANLKGINDCVTTEGEDPIYPNPGPDVAYAQGLGSSNTPSPGTCDSPSPYGQTYEDLGDNSIHTSSQGNGNTTAPQTAYGPSTNTSVPTTTASSSLATPSVNHTSFNLNPTAPVKSRALTPMPLVSAHSSSTTIVILDSKSTVTVTSASATYSIGATERSTGRYPPESTPVTGISPTSPQPPFATDLTQHLPCVPGTFICTSSTTWSTCSYNDGSVQSSETWIYEYPRPVAAGMECLPFLSPHSPETEQYGQQSNVQSGKYRDDRIVRARPDGDCFNNGSIQCADEGHVFGICDQGGWVNMGSVAAGTLCRNGAIVAA